MMKIEGVSQLISEWTQAIETGNPEIIKTSIRLCQFFSSASKAPKHQVEAIHEFARQVFAVLNPPLESPLFQKMLEISSATIIDPINNRASFPLLKLQAILTKFFPEYCFQKTEQDDILLDLVRQSSKLLQLDPTEIYENFSKNSLHRLSIISGFEQTCFAQSNYLGKELSFECNSFAQDASTLEATKHFLRDLLGADEDVTPCLAISQLLLNCFYETYPEMIGSCEVNVSHLTSNPYELESIGAAEVDIKEIDFSRQLKIASLWTSLKKVKELNLDDFVLQLEKHGYLNLRESFEVSQDSDPLMVEGAYQQFKLSFTVMLEQFEEVIENNFLLEEEEFVRLAEEIEAKQVSVSLGQSALKAP